MPFRTKGSGNNRNYENSEQNLNCEQISVVVIKKRSRKLNGWSLYSHESVQNKGKQKNNAQSHPKHEKPREIQIFWGKEDQKQHTKWKSQADT